MIPSGLASWRECSGWVGIGRGGISQRRRDAGGGKDGERRGRDDEPRGTRERGKSAGKRGTVTYFADPKQVTVPLIESSSLALRLTSSPPEASPAGLLRPTLVWLHAERAIHMVTPFQVTRSTRLVLAHRITRMGRVWMYPCQACNPWPSLRFLPYPVRIGGGSRRVRQAARKDCHTRGFCPGRPVFMPPWWPLKPIPGH